MDLGMMAIRQIMPHNQAVILASLYSNRYAAGWEAGFSEYGTVPARCD